MAKRPKKKPARGATAMRAAGNKLVAVWLDKNEAAAIAQVAYNLNKPLATWIRETAYRVATETTLTLKGTK